MQPNELHSPSSGGRCAADIRVIPGSFERLRQAHLDGTRAHAHTELRPSSLHSAARRGSARRGSARRGSGLCISMITTSIHRLQPQISSLLYQLNTSASWVYRHLQAGHPVVIETASLMELSQVGTLYGNMSQLRLGKRALKTGNGNANLCVWIRPAVVGSGNNSRKDELFQWFIILKVSPFTQILLWLNLLENTTSSFNEEAAGLSSVVFGLPFPKCVTSPPTLVIVSVQRCCGVFEEIIGFFTEAVFC